MREFLFFVLLTTSFLYVPVKYSAMIYQQNHYHMDRYLYWLKNNWNQPRAKQIFLALCVVYIGFFLPYEYQREGELLLMGIIAYISYKIEVQIKYRVPLKLTNRMKRFLLCSSMLYLLFGYAYFMLPQTLFILFLPFVFAMPMLGVMLNARIMRPIEKRIQAHFVHQAKQLLQDRKDLTIIAITGSFGKTSVKNILFSLLSSSYDTLMTPASYNNKMGITLTVRTQLKNLHEIFLCEMGTDHCGEIKEMMHFVQPSIGIVTAVGPQHLQTFHTMDAITKEKLSLIEALPANGLGILNADNRYISAYPLHAACKLIWFGKSEHAEYRIGHIQYHHHGTTFCIFLRGTRVEFDTCLLGEHNVYNICCAVALAHTLGMSIPQLQQLVSQIPYVKHRLQIVTTTPYTLIDDAYNANPVGAGNALEVLAQMEARTIIITPGMIDLGEREDAENKAFGKHMAHCVDEVILVGKRQSRKIVEGLMEEKYAQEHMHVCDNFQDAMKLLKEIVGAGDVVLLENDLPDAFNH